MCLPISSGAGSTGYGMENRSHSLWAALPFLYPQGFSMPPTARHRAKNPISAVKIAAAKTDGTPVEAFLSDARQRGLLPNRRHLWDHRRTRRREKNAVMERL
jgi:hypothetical protein